MVWVRTKAGKKMPVDATIAVENAVERDVTLTFEELREKLGAEAVVSHFSTCHEAGKWRRPR